tara:strand:- start:25594 stop:27615 length:2022 start_codon:yes stop_codon:yes gene_type:complete
MNKFKHTILTISAILMIVITLLFQSDITSANNTAQRINMIAIDPNTLTYEYGRNAIKSFMTLSSTLKDGDSFYILMMDDTDKLYGPYVAGNLNFNSYNEDLKKIIDSKKSIKPFSLTKSLTESYDFFSINKVAAGSYLYLISSDDIPTPEKIEQESLNLISKKFNEGEWKIQGLAFEGASQSTSELFEKLSFNTGADSLNVTFKDGFKSIADSIMSENSLGSLIPSSKQNLTQEEKLTSEIPIPPATNKMTIMIFKEDPSGSLRLRNPDGVESSASDRKTSRVMESPHVVIWELENPISGKWTIDISGINGQTSSWYQASSDYRVNLQSNRILPSNLSTELILYVTNEGLMIYPKDVYIEVTLITPSGNNVIYMLNDQGIEGDARAGDGYFSAKLPSSRSPGQYSAIVTLGWYNSPNTIIENISFNSQPFPTINLDSLEITNIYTNESTIVATAYVRVGEDPYPVSPSNISTSAQEDYAINLNPRTPGTDGKAWMYDVAITPSTEGNKPLNLILDINYAGTQHIQRSNLLNIATTNKPILSAEAGMNIAILMAIIFSPIVILLIAAGLYYQSKTQPFGYITNESGEPLIDFANLERTKLDKIFHINSVKGDDTGLDEMAGINFKFIGFQVIIENARSTPSVRLNNNPLLENKVIQDNDWIGSYGKLFNFKLSI